MTALSYDLSLSMVNRFLENQVQRRTRLGSRGSPLRRFVTLCLPCLYAEGKKRELSRCREEGNTLAIYRDPAQKAQAHARGSGISSVVKKAMLSIMAAVMLLV
ncbi:hypothetical protein B2K_40075 [Paenibacillus mucilaginosus K02]|uniref:Uncharacterized protein n=1 Tax=Paenibacillus mucilaginosus K02 TaxID=997761 RepID=R9UQ40_9BACL|nr:hypothetical protein B2K_40075 [Paenibacillus mucilaginosus K02]